MPLASGSQAQQEPHRAGGQAALIWVGDDRRIEQRRRLDGVLQRKVCSDQPLALLGYLLMRLEVAGDLLIAVHESGFDVSMPGREAFHRLREHPFDLGLVKPHKPVHDRPNPADASKLEVTCDHALVCGVQSFRTANNRYRFCFHAGAPGNTRLALTSPVDVPLEELAVSLRQGC